MLIPAGASGVDYSSGRPDPALLKARGDVFVCRYLTQTPSFLKATDLTEVTALHNAGFGVVLNGETSSGAALLGALQGAIDALAYVAAARKLKAPPGTTIVVSHDTSAWTDQVPLYFRAAYDIIIAAGYTFGVYGSGKIVQDCLDRGMTLTIIWATGSWAWPGGIHALAHIRQGGQTTVGGHLVDLNICKRPFQAWHPSTIPAIPSTPVVVLPAPETPALPKDSTMRLVYTTDQLGIWFINGDSIVHLNGEQADALRDIGVDGNFLQTTWIDGAQLATLQGLFPGSTEGTRQITGTFTGSST